MKLIAYDRPDGGVSVIHPAPKAIRPEETEADFLQRVADTCVPEGAQYRFVEQADIPQDRRFRGAWEAKGTSVSVGMPMARQIHMDRIRKARDKKLAEKDLEYMRADELADPQTKQRIASEKQALRDLPNSFDLDVASTPDELDALWPSDLPRE